ncbi:hypothetical protein C0Q70_17552 [Pomacea canaliculata]|uniref:Queuine tRNA-ribosyltransferase accessory subunit 2 n=2 Tax=Pomacea canaliculata TaxID=400727 RepID=A0A2T7NKS3_POMCA|nr:hypothetical protein C0Q70_17552 [Pomacea canaliculata]
MKFSVEKLVHGSCRLGLIREAGKNKSVTIETPFCLLYTRAGSVPNLSIDTLSYVQGLPPIAMMPLNLLAEHHESVEEYQKGLAGFTAMKDFLVYCSLQDPSTPVPSGYNEKSNIALWTRGGKTKVDPELFIKVQEAFKADWIQCMGDADTSKQSSKKRSRKAVDSSLIFLDELLQKRKTSKILQNAAIFGSVEGGFSVFDRNRSARETAARGVDGFVIEGFQNDGKDFCQFEDESFTDVLSSTLKHLPEDKPRLMNAVWRPDAIMQAIRAGIDIFDTSYAFVTTGKGNALVFSYDYEKLSVKPSDDGDLCLQASSLTSECGYSINLNDSRFREDFSPILEGCLCYTCKTYSRAYVNHLLNTTELQAGVLLMIHNLQHYLGFFSAVRQALREEKFHLLESLINRQRAVSLER